MRRLLPMLALFVLACLHTRGPRVESGAVAEDFALTSDDNEVVRLAEVNADRWAILVFYRGDW